MKNKRFSLIDMKEKKLIFYWCIFLSICILIYCCFSYDDITKQLNNTSSLIIQQQYDNALIQLTEVEKKWLVKIIGVKKQIIIIKRQEINILIQDLLIYDEGNDKFNSAQYQEAINLFSSIKTTSFYYADATLKIEQSKSELLKKEIKIITLAKQKAEKKAIDEENKRKQKEKQLSEQKEIERQMNVDADNDGLTYQEELKLGTSDILSDSDNDGLIDSVDSNPTGGGRNQAQTFKWQYQDYEWTWEEYIHEDWYNYYKNKSRKYLSVESIEYITTEDPFIQRISKQLTNSANKKGLEKVWLAVSFIQNLAYIQDYFTGYDEYPKYPVETFFEKNGDCEDTSYLTASILSAMNAGVVLVSLPGHMAVGVLMDCSNFGTYYKFKNKCYYYVETTSNTYKYGEIPNKYFNTQAKIIDLQGNIAKVYPSYLKPCYRSTLYSNQYIWYDQSFQYYSDSQCLQPI